MPVAPGSLTVLALVPAIVLAIVAGFVLAFADRRPEPRASTPSPPAATKRIGDDATERLAA
jgi:hypothetical protein